MHTQKKKKYQVLSWLVLSSTVLKQLVLCIKNDVLFIWDFVVFPYFDAISNWWERRLKCFCVCLCQFINEIGVVIDEKVVKSRLGSIFWHQMELFFSFICLRRIRNKFFMRWLREWWKPIPNKSEFWGTGKIFSYSSQFFDTRWRSLSFVLRCTYFNCIKLLKISLP